MQISKLSKRNLVQLHRMLPNYTMHASTRANAIDENIGALQLVDLPPLLPLAKTETTAASSSGSNIVSPLSAAAHAFLNAKIAPVPPRPLQAVTPMTPIQPQSLPLVIPMTPIPSKPQPPPPKTPPPATPISVPVATSPREPQPPQPTMPPPVAARTKTVRNKRWRESLP